jgi:PAS domain S-box-containing protein
MQCNDKPSSFKDQSLRNIAEDEIGRRGQLGRLNDADAVALCHELEVHQIELQMQNDEMRRVEAELAASEEKYRDLYEFAPVGYLTLEISGKVLEANLATAHILRTERGNLVNRSFQQYLAEGNYSKFNAFCRDVIQSDVKESAEFQLKGDSDKPCWVMIVAQSINDDIHHGIRMALIDITQRKLAEDALSMARDNLENTVQRGLHVSSVKPTIPQ